jgi:hypothetical protein
MSVFFNRCTRWVAPLLLAAGLILSAPMPSMVRAQAPDEAAPATGEEGTGRPWDGYFGTGVLVLLVLFIVGKSARR